MYYRRKGNKRLWPNTRYNLEIYVEERRNTMNNEPKASPGRYLSAGPPEYDPVLLLTYMDV